MSTNKGKRSLPVAVPSGSTLVRSFHPPWSLSLTGSIKRLASDFVVNEVRNGIVCPDPNEFINFDDRHPELDGDGGKVGGAGPPEQQTNEPKWAWEEEELAKLKEVSEHNQSL